MSSLLPAVAVSGSALQAERVRLDIISTNLANAQTTKDINGNPYQRKQVVFESFLPKGTETSSSVPASQGVRVAQIVEDNRPMTKVYMPSHPHADEQGMVTMPNVNVLEEMVDMMTASRSFEANLQVITTAKQMFNDSLKIAQA